MKKSTLITSTIALVAGMSVATGARAQTVPAGAEGTGCDLDQFTPIISEDTGEIMYWNNPTCPMDGGGSSIVRRSPTGFSIGYGF